MTLSTIAIGGICAAATLGVLVRPFRLPEAVWAVAGAFVLLATGLIAPAAAWAAVGKGGDVYLFLTGMMLLSEAARAQGLFDWVAAWAARHAKGSPVRLFGLVFAVGVVVTTFLSNDATAVVLTPAVYAAARRAKVDPLPLLFACAFVANAASFVLPISNPANLVLYGGSMPPLGQWLGSFTVPSLVSIALTYALLRLAMRQRLAGGAADPGEPPALSSAGRAALAGIGATAFLLMLASAFDVRLGWPTCVAGVLTALVVQATVRRSPLDLVTAVSWQILPLVAGLFVLVEALGQTGAVAALGEMLARAAGSDPRGTAAFAGTALGLGSNLVNNLPAGLIAAQAVAAAHPPRMVVDALLIGVDLGPNLSITGSLATILWLACLRREGEDMRFVDFLKVGAVVTLPTLPLAIGARLLLG